MLTINSFLLMFAAYLFLHLITTAITALGAKELFDVPSDISRWGLRFTIPDSSKLWTHSSVIGIYIISPIIFVIAIIISVRVFYPNRFKLRTPFKLFMVWLYVHAFNQLVGGLGLGVIIKKGAGYVPRWMGVSEPLIYGFSIAGLILLLINGLIVNDFFSAYAQKEEQLIKVKDQVSFKTFFVVLPVIIFIAGSLATGFPDWNLYTIGLHLTLLLPLPGIVFYHECLCEVNEIPDRWNRLFIGLIIAIGVVMTGLSIISVV